MTRRINSTALAVGLGVALACGFALGQANRPRQAVSRDQGGKLSYVTDQHGDRVPDFSYAGYRGSDESIPNVPVRLVVAPAPGDNTGRLQAAIDYVSSLPLEQRGAILLRPGKYEIHGALKIAASGVVLRGSGTGDEGTTLIAAGHHRRALISIAGTDDLNFTAPGITILDEYVPVNGMKLKVAKDAPLKAGDSVAISRGSAAPGGRGARRPVVWYRTVMEFADGVVTIDAPITLGIASDTSPGTIRPFTWAGELSEVGIENLRCESAYDRNNPKDEAHSWIGVHADNVRDSWVRRVTFKHFAASAVMLLDNTRRITVQDCKSLQPISEIAGLRRHTFFTSGGQTLFEHCYSENGRHDFAVGYLAPGPNAFVQCDAMEALDDSGPIDSLASGVLYDNVRIDGNAITLGNRGYKNAGAGWSAFNCLVWQSSAALFDLGMPPEARNWSIGCWGKFNGDGIVQNADEFVEPDSLFYGQLSDRLGRDKAEQRSDWMVVDNAGFTNPRVEVAAKKTIEAREPAQSLAQWIDDAAKRKPIPLDTGGAKSFDDLNLSGKTAERVATKLIALKDGKLVADGALVAGTHSGVQWWRGTMRGGTGAPASESGIALTRYAPGRTGTGLTDNLDEIAAWMVSSRTAALDHNYGLWYDQRMVDHHRVRRMDGDAWGPFFEWPFARSGGTELAWDGLSKYDLTKYNPWYFDRLREFAALCDQNGLVLFNNHFFQHSILEAGAHWSTCAWRTANNINNMGFPEPPNYAGDKRIFMAEQFYDVKNDVRREVYRKYIRHHLDSFAGSANVLHLISAEYSGPLEFTQFWLDTIAEWQRETGKKALVGLAAPKDVQDAILADSTRASVVSAIVIRYWWYQADGALYAPPGGKNLSPRQWTRITPNKPSSFAQVVRAVSEYRKQHPDKAVIYSPWMGDGAGWASLLAGGSLPQVKDDIDPKLRTALATMKPFELAGHTALKDEAGDNYLIHPAADTVAGIDLGAYTQKRVGGDDAILWLSRK